MNEIKMNEERITSLNQAIEEFNGWSKAAALYYNHKDHYFSTEVFHSDVQRSGTVFSDDCVVIVSKSEVQTFKVGQKRREYVLDFVDLILEGSSADQAEYELMQKYGPIGI